MEMVRKQKYFIAGYLAVLFFLLLCVTATPLLIRHRLSVSPDLIIKEEYLETLLIVFLMGVSGLIWKGYRHSVRSYEQAIDRAGEDKTKLVSRLAEAFNYIGTVNVELKELQAILCGLEHYPQTRKEFKHLVRQLSTKAMALTGVPWMVVRFIQRSSSRTIKEYALARGAGGPPPTTVGNRAILEGRLVEGMRVITTCQKNLDFKTALVMPSIELSDEEIVLVTAVATQIEMLYMLFRSGCFQADERSQK